MIDNDFSIVSLNICINEISNSTRAGAESEGYEGANLLCVNYAIKTIVSGLVGVPTSFYICKWC